MRVTICNRQRRWKVNTRLLRQIAARALALVGATEDRLNIVLVDAAAVARLNQQFHHREGPTDILTFDYGAGDVTGELVISIEHAVAQAKRFRSTPSRELALYAVHGILHLHGHDDLSPRLRARMRAAERRLMAMLAKDCDLSTVLQ
ncbi:MAG: rRNA maturation RNase YbeY [Verrucomicrobiia bacterium]